MRSLNWKYLAFLGGLILLYIILLNTMPRRFNWGVTFHKTDKNPFGSYIFHELLSDSWIRDVEVSYKTLYEINDSTSGNLLVICSAFNPSKTDMTHLFDLVNHGKTAIISAEQMDTTFTDTLGVELNKATFTILPDNIWQEDSLGIVYERHRADSSASCWLSRSLITGYFSDTGDGEILAKNTHGKAVALRLHMGEGSIILNTTPLIFSNYSILKNKNYEAISELLSYLPDAPLCWTEYYQMGRMESSTPMRYILSDPALSSAWYTLLVAILVGTIFQLKRKQRIIPVQKPVKNETMIFVRTVANLYYHRNDHKNLAKKKILHLTDFLKRNLRIDINEEIQEVAGRVALKTGIAEDEIRQLFDLIREVGAAHFVSDGKLKLLNDKINKIIKQ